MPLPLPFHVCPALDKAVEALSVDALSHRVVVENPFSKFTLLQDYPQPLEHYDDYEEYTFGELRAENTITEKFGQSVKVSKMSFVFFPCDPFLGNLFHYPIHLKVYSVAWITMNYSATIPEENKGNM